MPTEKADDLCFKTKLILEAGGKVVDTSVPIRSHIRCLSNLVEHMSANEDDYEEQATGSP